MEPRLLVVHRQGIGNYLLFLPTLERLRRERPEMAVDLFLESEGLAELARVDRRWTRVLVGRRGWTSLVPSARLLRARRPTAAWVTYPSGIRSFLLARLSGAPLVAGHPEGARARQARRLLTHPLEPVAGTHDVEENLRLLATIGVAADGGAGGSGRAAIDYGLPPAARGGELAAGARGDREPWVGIFPGSGAILPEKRWPAARFAALAQRLVDDGLRPIFFSGPDEAGVRPEVLAALSPAVAARVDWRHGAPLSEVAALLARCRAVVSNDSGLMHLAAALDVPVVGLFGPTDPVRVGPRPPSAPAVAVRGRCDYHPCYRPVSGTFRCRMGHAICMESIEVDEVLSATREATEKP